MTRAILVNFRNYTVFGKEFYEPLLDFMVLWLKKYENEYDKVYFLDSNWGIDTKKIENLKSEVIKVNESLRYYDVYKEILPQVKEDLILFVDNDMVIYREGIIDSVFRPLRDDYETYDSPQYDVVSIYDTIGTYKTDKLNGKNKFCPYLFATRKELLMKYRDIDWAPDMPYCETLGHLTEEMLKDGVKPYEMEEDKSNILTNGHQDGDMSKNLGYYHIRAGSSPAYLLATKEYGDQDIYWKYLRNQPKTEYLRQFAWYWWMCYETKNESVLKDIVSVLQDAQVTEKEWYAYFTLFAIYHGLKEVGN